MGRKQPPPEWPWVHSEGSREYGVHLSITPDPDDKDPELLIKVRLHVGRDDEGGCLAYTADLLSEEATLDLAELLLRLLTEKPAHPFHLNARKRPLLAGALKGAEAAQENPNG